MLERAQAEREAATTAEEGKAQATGLINEAAQQRFQGNAQALKQMKLTETALRSNAKIVITERVTSPTLFLVQLPVSMSSGE